MSLSRTSRLTAGLVGLMVAVASMTLPMTSVVFADDDDDEREGRGNRGNQNRNLRADPFVFIGDRGECGAGYPAGSSIVTAAWLGGLGLPDNGGPNLGTNPQDNPNKSNAHLGLLLNKNGPTADCSSAGVTIRGAEGIQIQPTTMLGFDLRDGTHCGAGAPRFNLTVKPPAGGEQTVFLGCAEGVKTPSAQDPQWLQVRIPASTVPPDSRISKLVLLLDEGMDTPSAQDPNGVGLAVVDNIYIDGKSISSGNGTASSRERGRDDDDDHRPKRRD